MARDGEQQAMTSERLAALAERAEHCYRLYVDDDTRLDRDYPDLPHDYCCDVEELLAEVERQRAENDELRQMASSLPVRYAAFQQRHGERRSGGDGA